MRTSFPMGLLLISDKHETYCAFTASFYLVRCVYHLTRIIQSLLSPPSYTTTKDLALTGLLSPFGHSNYVCGKILLSVKDMSVLSVHDATSW